MSKYHKLSDLFLLFSRSVVSDSLWPPWTAACQASWSFTVSQSLLRLVSIESVMLSNHVILCCRLLLPSVFPSIRVFSNESTLYIRWPKYWRFSFSICPSNEYSGLISFRIDWFDLFAVQGTLNNNNCYCWKTTILIVIILQFSFLYPKIVKFKGINLLIVTQVIRNKIRI